MKGWIEKDKERKMDEIALNEARIYPNTEGLKISTKQHKDVNKRKANKCTVSLINLYPLYWVIISNHQKYLTFHHVYLSFTTTRIFTKLWTKFKGS